MLPLDAATLTAQDAEINPMAALLRLQRCRRQAELPGLSAALFGALRRDGRLALAERLSDALLRMLAARFGGDETGAGHTEELRRALRHMEEPRMLAETVTQWRQEALDEGRRQGVSEGRRQGMSEGVLEGERVLLRRQATGSSAPRRATRWRRCWRTRTTSNGSRKWATWWSAARARRNCCVAAGVCSTAGGSASAR